MEDSGLDLRDWLLVILPFVGVIVGVLLTAGVEWMRVRHDVGLRRRLAARILADEVSWAHARVMVALQTESRSALRDRTTIENAWREHRGDLATLPWEEWHQVQLAVLAVQRYPRSDRWTTELDKPMLEDLRGRLTAAETILNRRAKP